MLQSGRNPPKKIIPADVYHASWYYSAVKVVTDAVVRGWGNQCQQLRIEYRKITGLQTQATFLKDNCGVVRKQDIEAKVVVVHIDMSGFAGESEGSIVADTGEATDASATRKRLLQRSEEHTSELQSLMRIS